MSGWKGSTRRRRLPVGWPKIRAAILERDGGICHVCRKPGADDVDHVRAGDDHRPRNLAAIHRRPCHERKSGQEGAAARRRKPTATIRRKAEKHPGLLP